MSVTDKGIKKIEGALIKTEFFNLEEERREVLTTVCRIVVNRPHCLDMNNWHTCDTVHCLAGWAIHLSGTAGATLEALLGTDGAGRLLIPGAAHLFYETDARVYQWCVRYLEQQPNYKELVWAGKRKDE